MSAFRDVDLGLYSIASTRENAAIAARAEARGFSRIWLAEDFHSRDIFVQAAATMAATKTIEIGFGIVNAFTRHPAQIAMGIADLEEFGGPRTILGLGASWSAIGAHGLKDPKPVRALRETAAICQGLLRGERTTYEGGIYRLPAPGVEISFPLKRKGVPLYLGSMGPRTIAACAPYIDGLLFSVLCSPAYIKGRMESVRAALAKAGRTPADIDISGYVIFAVDRDGDAARRAVRPLVGRYLRRFRDKERLAGAGLDPEALAPLQAKLSAAFDAGTDKFEAAAAEIPDHVVNALAVAGTPDECVAALRPYADAGIKRMALYHVLGPDRLAAVDLIADRVRPALI